MTSVMTSMYTIRSQFSDSPCVITMYGHVICKPQIKYLKKTYHCIGKYQVKSVLHDKIRNTALRLRNGNDACRNTKPEASIDSDQRGVGTRFANLIFADLIFANMRLANLVPTSRWFDTGHGQKTDRALRLRNYH